MFIKLRFLIIILCFTFNCFSHDKINNKSNSKYSCFPFITKHLSPKSSISTLSKISIHQEINKGIKILKGYQYWTVRDKHNLKKHVSILSSKGDDLLNELISFDFDKYSTNKVNAILKKIPSKHNLDLDLFIDILPSITDKEERKKYFHDLGVLLIHKGCYRQCAFCAYDAQYKYEKIPYPLIIKTLHELSTTRRSKTLFLYKDSDPLDYFDVVINADITNILEEMERIGLKTEINNNGWNPLSTKMNKLAQKIANFFSKGILTDLNLSYHLFYEDVINAVTKNDQIKISKLLFKYKKIYKNAIRQLNQEEPILLIKRNYHFSSILENEQLPKELHQITKLQINLYKEIDKELIDDFNIWEKEALLHYINNKFIVTELPRIYSKNYSHLPEKELDQRIQQLILILQDSKSLVQMFSMQKVMKLDETLAMKIPWLANKYPSYSPVDIDADTLVFKELFSIIKDFKYYTVYDDDITWDLGRGLKTLRNLSHQDLIYNFEGFLGDEYVFNPSGKMTAGKQSNLPNFFSPKIKSWVPKHKDFVISA